MLAAVKTTHNGLTVIELIVVVAITASVAAIAGPSFFDMIVTQRLRGVNAQLLTDLQFARSEALARNTPVRVIAGSNSSLSCYALVINDSASLCDCTKTPGSICTSPGVEVRTVQVNQSASVAIGSLLPATSTLTFYPVNGSTNPYKGDLAKPLAPVTMSLSIDGGTGSTKKRLTTSIQTSGRPIVCYNASSGYTTISGFSACAGTKTDN